MHQQKGEEKSVSDLVFSPFIRQGKLIYEKNCAYCHALDGTGQNAIGQFILPHPRNFTDPVETRGLTEARMVTSIREGREGTAMPAWEGLLSEEEIRQVVAYIRKAFMKQ